MTRTSRNQRKTAKQEEKTLKQDRKLPVWITIACRKVMQFVDNPLVLKKLNHVNSHLYGLQKRQRLICARMLCLYLEECEAEYNQIGHCGHEDMQGITHKDFRNRYEKKYGERIPESTYFDYIDLLKRAGYLSSCPLYIYDHVRLGVEKCWRSVASMKTLCQAFWKDLNIDKLKAVKESRKESIEKRIKRKLSNIWAGYAVFNERTKRRIQDDYIDTNDVPAEMFDTAPSPV